MKYYERDSHVPMKFYKVIKVILGLQIILGTLNLIAYLPSYLSTFSENGFDLYLAFLLALPIATLVLGLFALNGLQRMDWNGVKFLFAQMAVFFLSILLGSLETVNYDPYWSMIYLLVCAAYCAILFPVTCVYFRKRRLCFNPVPVDIHSGEPSEDQAQHPPEADVEEVDENQITVDDLLAAAKPEKAQLTQETSQDAGPNPSTIKKKANGKFLGILAICFAVLLVTSAAGNVYFYRELEEKDEKITMLRQSVQTYKNELVSKNKKLSRATKKADFMDEHIVIIPADGSRLYHAFDCPDLDMSEGFYAYNIEAARVMGFRPCPECYPNGRRNIFLGLQLNTHD